MNSHSRQCAGEVLDVIPLIMRSIRREMRSHRSAELSVPQFRALAFTAMNRGATLTDLASHLGLMAPAASKIVNGLVEAELMERRTSPSDRRCIWLALTPAGSTQLESTRRMARDCLAEMFAPLSAAECGQIAAVMRQLRALFE